MFSGDYAGVGLHKDVVMSHPDLIPDTGKEVCLTSPAVIPTMGCNPATYGIFSSSEGSHYVLSAGSLLTGGVKLTTEPVPLWCKASSIRLMQLRLFDSGAPPQRGRAGTSAGVSAAAARHGN